MSETGGGGSAEMVGPLFFVCFWNRNHSDADVLSSKEQWFEGVLFNQNDDSRTETTSPCTKYPLLYLFPDCYAAEISTDKTVN